MDVFNRLYRLETYPDCVIRNRLVHHGGDVNWNWHWRCAPRGREDGELQRLIQLLQGVQFNHGHEDSWKCTYVTDGSFSIKELASTIVKEMAYQADVLTIWSPSLPRKVNLFLWRARRDFLSCQ